MGFFARRRVLALLAGLLCVVGNGEAQTPSHPNHVIVLVDAGRAVERSSARAGSVSLARKTLVEILTGRRSWEGLPSLASNDLLTIHHYGLNRRLRGVDVRRDFLRTKLGLARHASAETIAKALKPGAAYDLTSWSWARAMGLADAKVPPGTRVQRTYLVLLSAPEGPDNGPILNRSVAASYSREVKDLNAQVDDRYRFVRGETREVRAGPAAKAVSLTVWEVIPRAFDAVRAQGGSDPTASVKVRWRREGIRPVAEVVVQPRAGAGELAATVAVGKSERRIDPRTSGVPLHLAIAFDALPVRETKGRLDVASVRTVTDLWLGTARVEKAFTREITFPVPMTRRLVAGLLTFVMGLVGAALLGAAVWLIHQGRTGRHFGVRLPGHGSWMPLPPLGGNATIRDTSSHPALPRGEALRIQLPIPFFRWLFYRDFTLSLSGEGGKLRWKGFDGNEVPISAFGKEAIATWDEAATYGVAAAVEIRRRDRATRAEIEYPRLNVARLETHRTMKYHVALDLGSDSMAAYFASDRESRMVPLQEYAPLTVTNRRPDFLRTPDANGEMKVSSRLRSRIVLSSNQSDPNLPESHATLDFWDVSQAEPMLKDGYRQSIFDFWQPELTPPLMNTTLPNPKVMFQYGVEDAFPAARTLSGEAMHLTPETVAGHLTVQVLRNLVLRAGPLKRIDPSEVEVILTVPNVYSVEHADNLRETVERLAGVGRVTTISESDALAYYYLAERRPTVRVQAGDDDAPSAITQILTIDVGRGTTDLSLMQTQRVEGEERVWVRARTGRSSGGGELTYLFVQFYEREIRRVFREHGELLAYRSEALSREQTEPPMSFLWLKNRALADADPMYGKAFYAMAELVEEVKRAFGEHYLMKTPASAQGHVQTIVDALMRFTEYAFIDVPGWKEGKVAEIEQFRQHLVDALNVNAQLGVGRNASLALSNGRSVKGEMNGWWQRTVAGIRGSRRIAVVEPPTVKSLPETDRSNLDWLARNVRDYVRKNVHHLLVELGTMVANQEDRAEFAQAESLDEKVEIALRALVEPGRTHVVVGGQASQFGPLKRAIYGLFKPMQGEELAALTMLVGQDAKDACCQGAVIYATSGHQPQNRDALHGSYGFVDVARTEGAGVYPIDTRKLNDEGEDRVRTPSDVARYLVFTPGTFGGSDEEIDEAMLSRLGRFRGREYCVTYGRDEGDVIRRLRVDGEEVRLSTFGDLKDNIWKKVWPDQLPREPQS